MLAGLGRDPNEQRERRGGNGESKGAKPEPAAERDEAIAEEEQGIPRGHEEDQDDIL